MNLRGGGGPGAACFLWPPLTNDGLSAAARAAAEMCLEGCCWEGPASPGAACVALRSWLAALRPAPEAEPCLRGSSSSRLPEIRTCLDAAPGEGGVDVLGSEGC